jgi:hypothetical protein
VLGICGIDSDNMFVDMVVVHMVQMTVVKVIYMAVMPDCGMAAARPMPMGVVGMVLLNASDHFPCSFLETAGAEENLPPAWPFVIAFIMRPMAAAVQPAGVWE